MNDATRSLHNELIKGISASYGVEPTGRDSGTVQSMIEYVTSVISPHTLTLNDSPLAPAGGLPDRERRERLAAAIVWSILSRLNLRELVGHDHREQRAIGYDAARSDLQLELDEIATGIEDHKMPGDGPRGYVRGLRFAAARARELRSE